MLRATIGAVAGRAAIYTHPGFLSPARLGAVCAHVHAAAADLAAVQAAPGAPLEVHEEVRRTWDVDLPEALHDELVASIRAEHAALESFFALRLAPCDAVAALRYPPGAFYRTHRDVAARPDPHGLHLRAVSVVIFLNTAAPGEGAAFSGGTLRLHDDRGRPTDVVPTAGTLVAFRSSVLHEVLPVDRGTRLAVVTWLMREDGALAGAT